MILNVEGEEDKVELYLMVGFINGNKFKAMIDSGSPVTFFALDQLKNIMKRNTLQVREMVTSEQRVDFNGKPLNLGCVVDEFQIGEKYVKKARMLVAKKGQSRLWEENSCLLFDISSPQQLKVRLKKIQ